MGEDRVVVKLQARGASSSVDVFGVRRGDLRRGVARSGVVAIPRPIREQIGFAARREAQTVLVDPFDVDRLGAR